MPASKLSSVEIDSALRDLPQWRLENEKLHRKFQFSTFAEAIGFMTIAAIDIEKRDHHPEWCNVYNRVSVHLTTHDAGGITAKDIALALSLDKIAAKLT